MPTIAFCLIAALATAPHDQAAPQGLSALPLWEDGLSEMSYYDAVDRIYGKDRKFSRVHLFNRQWLDAATGVKAKRTDPGAVPVFKLNIAEQIPTDNYNYRYLTTVFVRRPDLTPMKMVSSSQEWCGTTFKHLRFRESGGTYRSFSYFPGEADQEWTLADDVVTFEALFVIARDVAARNTPRVLRVLASVRSNHQVKPNVRAARLAPGAVTQKRSGIGTHDVRRVDLQWEGPTTFFVVEANPPYRLIRFQHGNLRGTLKNLERRAYWDRSKKSAVYEQNHAP